MKLIIFRINKIFNSKIRHQEQILSVMKFMLHIFQDLKKMFRNLDLVLKLWDNKVLWRNKIIFYRITLRSMMKNNIMLVVCLVIKKGETKILMIKTQIIYQIFNSNILELLILNNHSITVIINNKYSNRIKVTS